MHTIFGMFHATNVAKITFDFFTLTIRLFESEIAILRIAQIL